MEFTTRRNRWLRLPAPRPQLLALLAGLLSPCGKELVAEDVRRILPDNVMKLTSVNISLSECVELSGLASPTIVPQKVLIFSFMDSSSSPLFPMEFCSTHAYIHMFLPLIGHHCSRYVYLAYSIALSRNLGAFNTHLSSLA